MRCGDVERVRVNERTSIFFFPAREAVLTTVVVKDHSTAFFFFYVCYKAGKKADIMPELPCAFIHKKKRKKKRKKTILERKSNQWRLLRKYSGNALGHHKRSALGAEAQHIKDTLYVNARLRATHRAS